MCIICVCMSSPLIGIVATSRHVGARFTVGSLSLVYLSFPHITYTIVVFSLSLFVRHTHVIIRNLLTRCNVYHLSSFCKRSQSLSGLDWNPS